MDVMHQIVCSALACAIAVLLFVLAGPWIVGRTCGRACSSASVDLSTIPWKHSGESRRLHMASACVAGAVAALSGASLDASAISLIPVCSCLGLAAGAMLETDVAYRLLPYEINLLLLASGAVLQLQRGGSSSLMIGSICGLSFAAATLVCRLVGRRIGRDLVGGGDIGAMLAVSVSCGSSVLIGALVAFPGVLLWRALDSAIRKTPWDEEFPMAPVFVAWLVSGLALT